MISSHTSAKLSNSQTIGGMIGEATLIVIVIGLGIHGSAAVRYRIALSQCHHRHGEGIYMLTAMGLNYHCRVRRPAGSRLCGLLGGYGAYTTAIVTGAAPFHRYALGFTASDPHHRRLQLSVASFFGLVACAYAVTTLPSSRSVSASSALHRQLVGQCHRRAGGIHRYPPILYCSGFDFGLDPRHYVALIWVFIGILYFLIANLWRSRQPRMRKRDEDAAEIAVFQPSA